MEDALRKKIGSRKAALAKLTAKKNAMPSLMDDDGNLELIKNRLVVEFNKLFEDFCELNISFKELHQKITSEEEVTSDQDMWFKPKSDALKTFSDDVEFWIRLVNERMKEAKEVDENIKPSDSVSEVSSQRSNKSKASSSASSARLQPELEKAALLAKAATLKRKKALEKQEVKIKAEKEELELQAALAAGC